VGCNSHTLKYANAYEQGKARKLLGDKGSKTWVHTFPIFKSPWIKKFGTIIELTYSDCVLDAYKL